MSARPLIAIKTDKGYKAIYNHFDGDSLYPILTENYTDENKVKALIALGDISFLGEEIGPHPSPKNAVSTPYTPTTSGASAKRNRRRNKPNTTITRSPRTRPWRNRDGSPHRQITQGAHQGRGIHIRVRPPFWRVGRIRIRGRGPHPLTREKGIRL